MQELSRVHSSYERGSHQKQRLELSQVFDQKKQQQQQKKQTKTKLDSKRTILEDKNLYSLIENEDEDIG